MSWLLTIVAHSVCCGCSHQRALDDVVGVISDAQVGREVRAEIIYHALQHGGMCWRRGSAPYGTGGLLIAKRVVCWPEVR